MTQRSNSKSTALTLCSRFLLVQGLGWLSALGILAGGAAWAQTPSSEGAAIDAGITEPLDAPSAPAADPLPISGVESEPMPSSPVESAPAATDSDEAYIDSTHYNLGATPHEEEKPAPIWQGAPGAIASQAAPVSVGVGSIQFNGLGRVIGGSTAAGRYYFRTTRPAGRLGNGNIRLIFPLSIPAAITSVFGWRVHPITGDQRFHSGTDLGAPLGTPVLAAYAGRVAIADFLGGYGLTVALEHNKQTQETLYAHLSEIFVKPGEWVNQGTVIGRVGSTGNSTGPHLHFEFRQLTADGWVAMDAGTQLEYALAQLVKAMQTAKSTPNTKPVNAG